jgi:hypothetical protein
MNEYAICVLQYPALLSQWEAGNQFIASAREVSFQAATRPAGFNITASRFWQYIHLNGAEELAYGYDATMDTMVRPK